MNRSTENERKRNMLHSIERDMKRYEERESARRSFWRSLGVLGSVGWPIVVMTVGGAWIGSWLDRDWGTGVRLTMILVFVGAILGSSVAWSIIQGTKK